MVAAIRILGLGSLRISSLALMLAQNVLLVRFLTLEQIGVYYVIGTIAYVGNAMVFVGADLNLQQYLTTLSKEREISGRGLSAYALATAVPGSVLVGLFAALYFHHTQADAWPGLALLCVCMSLGTYASSVGRNLCQLATLPTFSSLGPLVEGLVRCSAIAALATTHHASASTVAAASAFGSFCSASVTIGLLLSRCRRSARSYLTNSSRLINRVIHVGGSGLANWAQLQGYRPIVGATPAGAHVVGTVAFMTTLGSTAANSVFTIMALFQMPRQYSSNGETSGAYIRLIGVTTIALALLSLPAGLVFLQVAHRQELFALVYLVAVGVAIESGNAVIGVCTNHLNVTQRSMATLSKAGIGGCLITFALLFLLGGRAAQHLQLAVTLVVGQACTVATVLYLTFAMKGAPTHVEQ